MTDRSTVTSSTVTGSAAGVITRRILPAPTDVTVYELTDAGRALQPALNELLHWGLRYVPEPSQDDDSGVASSLLNTGQQLGGSIGLAVLGTVAWTVVAHSIHAQAAAAAQAGHPARPGGPLAAAIYNHALATGFARAFLAAAAIALLTLAINIAVIRVRRADLAGAPHPEPAAPAHPAPPAVIAKDANDRRDPDDNSRI